MPVWRGCNSQMGSRPNNSPFNCYLALPYDVPSIYWTRIMKQWHLRSSKGVTIFSDNGDAVFFDKVLNDNFRVVEKDKAFRTILSCRLGKQSRLDITFAGSRSSVKPLIARHSGQILRFPQ